LLIYLCWSITILMITHIATVSQLNAFIGTVKIHSPDKIISSLVDEKVIINHSVAKLVISHDSRDSRT